MTRRRRVRERVLINKWSRIAGLLGGEYWLLAVHVFGKRAGRRSKADRKFEAARKRFWSVESNRQLMIDLADR